MKQSGKCLLLLLVICAACMGGCTSIPLGSPVDDLRAKSAVVTPGMAQIFVYRHESLGFAAPITVKLDGRTSGRTVGQTYVMWEVEPGLHEISSHAEGASTVSLNVEPGKSYFIWQEVKVGLWKARSSLHQVDEETGRKFLAECRLGQVGTVARIPSLGSL
jgi:hypothetical protein